VTNRFASLSPDALAEAMVSARSPTLVDVRELARYEAGHIAGSVHVPVYDLGSRRASLPASVAQRLVIIGDHRKRAHAAATFLALIGFGDVYVLEGGIAAWSGPIEIGPAPPPPEGQGPGPVLRIVP